MIQQPIMEFNNRLILITLSFVGNISRKDFSEL